jgi:hypothetical protein
LGPAAFLATVFFERSILRPPVARNHYFGGLLPPVKLNQCVPSSTFLAGLAYAGICLPLVKRLF